MGIQRYSSARVYAFDLPGRAPYEPYVAPTGWTTSGTSGNTAVGSAFYGRLGLLGPNQANTDLYYLPPLSAISNQGTTAWATVFGSPIGALLATYHSTYYSYQTNPAMAKTFGTTVHAAFTFRCGNINSATAAVAPVLQLGLTSINNGVNASSYITIGSNGTAHANNVAQLAFTPTNAGSSTQSFTLAGDTEYPCTFLCNPDGTGTFSLGTNNFSFTMTNPLGNFWISLGHSSTTINNNVCGMKGVRVNIN